MKKMRGNMLFCSECEKKPESRRHSMGTFKGGWHSF